MKKIKFRPLRRVKKTGQVVVASYQQWRSIKTADYSEFQLSFETTYAEFDEDEVVHNHLGEPLFWYQYLPDAITEICIEEVPRMAPFELRVHNWAAIHHLRPYAVRMNERWTSFTSCRGLDCDGVPTFSHYTSEEIAKGKLDPFQFEPLTVGMVKRWLEWFIMNLKNPVYS